MIITQSTGPVKRKIFTMAMEGMRSDTKWSVMKLVLIAELYNTLNYQREHYVRFKDRICRD